jgi:hypothetical protein
MAGPQFGTIRAVSDAVKAQLVTDGVTAAYVLGKKTVLAQRGDPISGRVVVVPSPDPSPVSAPRFEGSNADETRATYTISQQLRIHTWARAAVQSDPSTQYAADLEAAELLRNAVLRAFDFVAPGANRGGTTAPTDAGENIYGVEIVTTISVFIETLDTPWIAVPDLTITPNVVLTNTHGSADPADWTDESATGA